VALLYAGACLVALVVLFFDVTVDSPIAAGVGYVPLVLSALYLRNRHSVWLLTSAAVIMAIVGFFLPVLNLSWVIVINRVLSLGVLLLTGFLVSHQKKINRQLAYQTRLAQNANAAKTRLLQNVSHEFRTPLNAMVGFAEILRKSATESQIPTVDMILEGGHRLSATIQNLIDFTDIETTRIEIGTIDIMPIVRSVAAGARPIAEERGVEISIEPLPQGAAIPIGNEWAARRILENLVDNAVKFSSTGSRVRLVLRETQLWMIVEVVDQGPGLDRELIGQLGRPFVQGDSSIRRRHEGLGIGFALASRLAHKMQGRLEIVSDPGRGTTVSMALPIRKNSRTDSGETQVDAHPDDDPG
jgi:signal transduction histidine kinase